MESQGRAVVLGAYDTQLSVWRSLLGSVHHTRIAIAVKTRQLGASRYLAEATVKDARDGHVFQHGGFVITIPLVANPTPQQIQRINHAVDPVHPADRGGRVLADFPPHIPFGSVIEIDAHAMGRVNHGVLLMALAPLSGYVPEFVTRGRQPDYSLIEGERLIGNSSAYQLIDLTLSPHCRYVEEIIDPNGRVKTRRKIPARTAIPMILKPARDVFPRWRWTRRRSLRATLSSPPDTIVIPHQPRPGKVRW